MAAFFSELKRRSVFRVGAAYAVVSWLILQVVDVALPRLGLPDWTITLILVLLLIGFPIALVLAWAFDLTPEGVKKTARPESGETPVLQSGHKLNYIIAVALVAALGFIAYQNLGLSSEPAAIEATGVDKVSRRPAVRGPIPRR